MDEKSLVLKAQEGNQHAMNRLLQDNYKALYGFTLKMTANQHENAKKYLNRIEELTDTRISIVSVGPKRSQTIRVKEI